jgi:hypothetical protein
LRAGWPDIPTGSRLARDWRTAELLDLPGQSISGAIGGAQVVAHLRHGDDDPGQHHHRAEDGNSEEEIGAAPSLYMRHHPPAPFAVR